MSHHEEGDDDFSEYRLLILSQLEQLNEKFTKLSQDVHSLTLNEARSQASTKIISTIFGSLSGIATAILTAWILKNL